MHKRLCLPIAAFTAATFLAWVATPALAIDLESFEFNDSNFTELGGASNTANPGNNWSIDALDMTDSFVLGGSYEIHKFNDNFADNFLQIDNVASGKRYIVVKAANWDFRGPDVSGSPSNPEQIRFAFLNDDTGTDGSAILAQMQITRDTTNEGIQLEGSALGTGATDLRSRAPLNTVQTAPFTMVLEIDKTNNLYEVFYKDGTNPSQSLAQGFLDPTRDGNSIRFVVNNNFGSEIEEVFAIDRIAISDTNPIDDVLTIEVDRDTGIIKLVNTTGTALSGLESYTLTSSIGALDSAGWKPITDNYDNAAGPGDGSVDADDDWAISSSLTNDLSEAVLGGNGGNLSIAQEVLLSTEGGAWIQNPIEDIVAELTFAGGVVRRPSVHFVGNGGARFEVGDLNFDGSITADDWPLFIAGSEVDLSALSAAQAYQLGDLNFGGVQGFADFEIFKETFEAANGIGSFALMIAGVPEPGSFAMLMLGCLGLASSRGRRNSHR